MTEIERDYSETSLQIYAASYLAGEIQSGRSIIRVPIPFPGFVWTAHLHENQGAAHGHKLKRMGNKRGWSDIIGLYNKLPIAIELKKPKGIQSGYQHDFEIRWVREGGVYAICKSVANVRDQMIAWGFKCENMNCIEPPPTFQEKVDYMKKAYARIDDAPLLPIPPKGKGFDY